MVAESAALVYKEYHTELNAIAVRDKFISLSVINDTIRYWIENRYIGNSLYSDDWISDEIMVFLDKYLTKEYFKELLLTHPELDIVSQCCYAPLINGVTCCSACKEDTLPIPDTRHERNKCNTHC